MNNKVKARLRKPVEYFKTARWKISRYQDGKGPKTETPAKKREQQPRCPSEFGFQGKLN